MTIQTVAQGYNPITGVFGTGNVQFFASSGTWVVPQGIGKVRVRLWGAGGCYSSNASNYGGGGGGGFAIKTIYDLTGVTSIPVTVGAGVTYTSTTTATTAGTSSFGSYVSATGGSTPASSPSAVNGLGGTGVGGDINTSGGYALNNGGTGQGGGGGCGSIFGNGGNGNNANMPNPSTGGAGAGQGYTSASPSYSGGQGFLTAGGIYNSMTNYVYVLPQATASNAGAFSLDFIGTGGGGGYGQMGVNGGGGGYPTGGGFPGGGCAYGFSYTSPGGLVIVEW